VPSARAARYKQVTTINEAMVTLAMIVMYLRSVVP